jgi:hypothetical protein
VVGEARQEIDCNHLEKNVNGGLGTLIRQSGERGSLSGAFHISQHQE